MDTASIKLQPVLLLSHGASILTADASSPLHQNLVALGQSLRQQPPRALLIVSAHFIEPHWTLTTGLWPETIHDHPVEALRSWQYGVPGAADVAARAAQLLQTEGLDARLNAKRGLDHGAWLVAAPLMPSQHQIPVLQLSLHADLNPATHLQAGRALRQLRAEDVLIVTSGGMTHNQQEFRAGYLADKQPEHASIESQRFDGWIREQLTATSGITRSLALSDFSRHPHAKQAHPTIEHLLPLFFGLGAAENTVASELWGGFQYGLSTAAYLLD